MQEYYWVLGATGYVGSAVVRELQKRVPGAQIVAVGHWTLDATIMENTHFLMAPLDVFDLTWLEKYPPSHVFHCARLAGSSPTARKNAAQKGERANLRWLAALEDLARPPIVVYCSGTLMYGNSEDKVLENSRIAPIAYARAYERAERPWRAYDVRNGLAVRMAYPAWIFGPNSWFKKFFYEPAVRDGVVPFYGVGEQLMSLVHLEDVAYQLVEVGLGKVNANAFNIYAAPPVSQRAFAERIAAALGVGVRQVDRADVDAQVWEALTSSIPVDSEHKNWRSGLHLKYPRLEDMIADVLRELE